MSQPQPAPEYASPAAPTASRKPAFSSALAWVICGILTLVAGWRLFLAVSILMQSNLAGMFAPAVVHWRRLDEFLPWLTLAILSLAKGAPATGLGQMRLGRIVASLLAVGTLLTALGIGLDEADIATGLATTATRLGLVLLFLLALTQAAREVRGVQLSLRRGSGRGVTIVDLWRFAAAQGALLMAAALCGIALASPKAKWLGDETIRQLFFFLPTAAALPNVLAYAGISLWNDLLLAAKSQPAKPRVRAWLLAFACLSIGPLVFLAGLLPRVDMWHLILPGAAFILAGIVFYLVGFPVSAWRGIGGIAHLAAWFCIALALLAAVLDVARPNHLERTSPFYASAWRFLWTSGITFWLLSIGITAFRLLISETRATRWGTALLVLISIGTLATTAILLATSAQTGEAQLPLLRWIAIGTGITFTATVLAGVALLNARRR